jgi:hypothetical protein
MSKKPAPRLRRVKTKTKQQETTQQEAAPLSAAEKQELQAIQWIMHHQQYPNFLQAIRLGTTNADIADHFIERGYVSVTRKTLMLYLAAFRRKCPDLCKPRGVDTAQFGIRDYDHLFDGNMTAMSIEVEMAKLIAVQKQRIAIDYINERSIGKLFGTTQKEVQVLGELFERFHKIKNGEKGSSGHGSGVFTGNEDEIRDGLNAIRQDEMDRNITSNAIKQLVKGVVGR